jgi:hypothetical protein
VVTVLIVSIAIALLTVGLVHAGRSCGLERQPNFGRRLLVLSTLLPLPLVALLLVAYLHLISQGASQLIGSLLPLFGFALVLVPGLLFRPMTIPPPERDDDDGFSRGPDDPPPDSPPPTGGIPLLNAEQARVRLRDHDDGGTKRTPARRPAREPDRSPLAPSER